MATTLHQPIPALLSAPRLITLFASLLVSVASGTNYVFSAWAPQLGAKLRLSHTQLNVIGLAGNVGVYASGPVWGRIVDSRGPRILLAGGFVFSLLGYAGIRHFFDTGLLPSETALSTFNLVVLILCSCLTGAGGNGGLTSSVNSTAKSFPDRARASTTGLVISGFGLSAFIFSTVAHIVFPGDTSSFLLLLSVGTALPMILGFFLVRPIPLPPDPHTHEHPVVEGDADAIEAAAVIFQHEDNSSTHLLFQDDSDDSDPSDTSVYDGGNALELSRSLSPETYHHRSISSSTRRSLSSHKEHVEGPPNIHGFGLWKRGDFWLLFSMLSMLSGTGLMYINNVGVMSQALYAYNNTAYDDVKAQKWQAVQVSTISITNFAGRIIIGLISDITKVRFKLPRSYCLVLVSSTLLASQYVATHIESIDSLWIASGILGLGYGSMFSLFPAMCIEWFGLPHFSENWGYLSTSPLFGGNLFSIAFGRNFDAHEPPERRGLPTTVSRLCLEGKGCYVNALYLTMFACTLCVFLSLWAAWRDRKRALAQESRGHRRIQSA
ncbi:MFS transporter superfamily protein [Pleurotus pulmonarius]|nr:hypothetical protein EYR38_005094 [Pleurotus pulmonarius]